MANAMQANGGGGGGSHNAHQSDYGVDENALSSEEVEELHACIRENDIAAVSAILNRSSGSDEYTEDEDGRESRAGSVTRSERANAAVSARDKRNRSAVHIAALANVGNEMRNLIVSVANDVNGKDVCFIPRQNTLISFATYDSECTHSLSLIVN